VEPIDHLEWWRPPAHQPTRDGAIVRRHATSTRVAFWALMIFMGIMLLAPQAIFPVLAPLRIALLTASVAVIAHVLDCLTAGRPIAIVTRELRIAACLLGWAAISVPFSLWPGGSLTTLTDLFLKAIVLFWLVSNTVTTVARLRQFAWGLALMSVPIAMTAFVNFLSGRHLQGSERIVGYDAPLTSNPNDLALTLNLIIPFTLALVGTVRRPSLRIVLFAFIAVNIVGVILTFSRGGFITLAVILAITIVKLVRSRRRAWGIALFAVLLLGVPFLPGSYWLRLTTITDIESDETGSAQARLASTLGALRFVLVHPVVGAGIGSDVLALNEEIGSRWSAVHNVYLQYAVDLGLPGLGLFLALFATCFAAASAARSGVGEGRDAHSLAQFAQATMLSLIAFGVAGFFHPVAYNFYFYYLAGLASACRLAMPRVRVVRKVAH